MLPKPQKLGVSWDGNSIDLIVGKFRAALLSSSGAAARVCSQKR